MSQEAARTFLSQIQDESLLLKAKESASPLDLLVAAGVQAGFEFTGTELIHAAAAHKAESSELSEEQLEAVTGGAIGDNFIPGASPIADALADTIQGMDPLGGAGVPGVEPIADEP